LYPGSTANSSLQLLVPTLFQFGTSQECIPQATLDLNLILGAAAIWTKIRSGNTLAMSRITKTIRFWIDRF
jgi:hypothetical protein